MSIADLSTAFNHLQISGAPAGASEALHAPARNAKTAAARTRDRQIGDGIFMDFSGRIYGIDPETGTPLHAIGD